MTDNDIIKALECESVPSECNCVYGEYIEACGIYCGKKKEIAKNCHDCKEHSMAYYGRRAKATLDLINRQKAELNQYAKEQHELMIEKDKLFDIAEKQKAEIEEQDQAIVNALKRMGQIRAEAITEFAERLKATPMRFHVEYVEYYDKPSIEKMVLFIDDNDINQIAKEMKEGE